MVFMYRGSQGRGGGLRSWWLVLSSVVGVSLLFDVDDGYPTVTDGDSVPVRRTRVWAGRGGEYHLFLVISRSETSTPFARSLLVCSWSFPSWVNVRVVDSRRDSESQRNVPPWKFYRVDDSSVDVGEVGGDVSFPFLPSHHGQV